MHTTNTPRLRAVVGSLAIAIAALSPALGGCQKMREKVFEKEVAAQTGVADAGPDPFAGDDPLGGAMLPSTTTIPPDFPKDIPFYPGSRPMVATTTRENGTGEPQYTVVAQTSDTPEQVMSFYRSKFPKPEVESSFAAGHVMTIKTPDGTAASVTAAPAGGKTIVSISAGKRATGPAAP